MRNFIFVVGATASGKSDWALEQAQKNSGVIFNCDSVQLYQEVNIGSAKPSKEELAQVPHYLIDVVTPPNEITSGDYRDLFLAELKNIPLTTPIYVVGGTGFYFLALEKGLYEIEEASPSLKDQIQSEAQIPGGVAKLLEEVRSLDPAYAQKLHVNDQYRVTRAIEILRSNPGKTISALLQEKKESKGLEGHIKKIGIKRTPEDLEARIRLRTQKMLSQGLIEDTQNLLSRGLENCAISQGSDPAIST